MFTILTRGNHNLASSPPSKHFFSPRNLGVSYIFLICPISPDFSRRNHVFSFQMEETSRKKAEEEKREMFSERTLKVYEEVGLFMSKYRSGKIPRVLRIVPSLKNWLDVLWLTKPEKWTPHGLNAVTPIFVHNLKEAEAQSFMRYVVLPAVQKSIDDTDRLNVHLYEALRRCLYKPAAFFKGIFFPMILQEDCTYKQASILCSVVSKESFPALHAAAVLVKLTHVQPHTNKIDYAIIKLLNKKHDLPVPAVKALKQYFNNYVKEDSTQSVIFHQSLLVFIQRWKSKYSDTREPQFLLICPGVP